MTLDQLQQRDQRISTLEALGERRSISQQDELVALEAARDLHWRRLPLALARAARKARDLEHYARQIGLPLERLEARLS